MLSWVCSILGIFFFCYGSITLADSQDLFNKPLLRSVHFVDDRHGWITGYNGIYYTDDGGVTWRVEPVLVGKLSSTLGDLSVQYTGAVVWSDQSRCVIRVEKGLLVGDLNLNRWITVQSRLLELERVRSIVFVNSKRGWAIAPGSPGSLIYGTNDGGFNWNQEFRVPETLYGIFVNAEADVWAVGSGCLAVHTNDGGKTWNKAVIAAGRQKDGRVNDFHTSYFVGSKRTGWIAGTHGTILRTTDGGREWLAQSSGFSRGTTFHAMSFASEDEGWVIGTRYSIDEPHKESTEAIVLHTSDAGLRWQKQSINIEEKIMDIQALSNGRAWLVGEDGSLFRTVDHGRTWDRQRLPSKPGIPPR
jgi:photosystem II stability/assembly factor-like uncharacterized protein